MLGVLCLVGLPALAYAQNGTVTGTVTNAATAAPLVGRSLVFCTGSSNSSSCFSSTNTDASGNYTISLAPGSYVAFTGNFNTLGFINEIYDNIACPGFCSTSTALTSGTAIVVTSGATVTGKNFALDPGGSVTGTVTDTTTGLPVANAFVVLRTLVGTANLQAGSATTNASGTYSIPGLPTGVYYAYTSTSSVGYTSEIYDNILCPGFCSSTTAVNSGAPIAVTTGAATGGINFGLEPGGRITGTIVSSQGGTPLQSVSVSAVMRIGLTVTTIGSGFTNASGAYTIGGLPTGTYYLYTSGGQSINEIYDNIPCPLGCTSATTAATGAAVAVTTGTTTSGRDFQLDPGGAVSGTITDAVSALPLANVFVQIYRQTGSSATAVTSGSTNASGVYTVGGLTTGTYFAAAFPGSNYVREVLGGNQCIVACFTSDLTASTPIAVTNGATTSGQNFALDIGGTITGTVTSAATGAPLVFGTVVLPTSNGSIGFGTNALGGFTITGVPAGSFKLYTSVGQYTNEMYNNIPCPGSFCASNFITGNGTPVTVTSGATTSGINFALDPLQAAPGAPFSLTAAVTGGTAQISWSAPTSGGAAVSYVLEAGLSPGTTIGTLPAATNALTIPGVPPGTFYLRVRAVNAFGTGPASSEFKLVVGNGGTATPDPPTNLVAWMSGGRLTMTWTAPATGQTPGSYVIEAGSAVGLSNLAVVEVGTRSFTFDPIPGGFFFLRVRSKAGALVSIATPDVMINVGNVPAPPSPPQNFFTSLSGSTATLSWTAPVIGTATSYIVEAGTATGLANIGVVNTGSTATTLSVPGVPSGTYYLRVRSVNALGASPVSNERVLIVP